eukprot:IDg1390t1
MGTAKQFATICMLAMLAMHTYSACSVCSEPYQFSLGEWHGTVLQDGEFGNVRKLLIVPEFVSRRAFEFYNPGQPQTASQNVLLMQRGNDVLCLIPDLEPSKVRKPASLHQTFVASASTKHRRAYLNARVYIAHREAVFWWRNPTNLVHRAPDLPFGVLNNTALGFQRIMKAYRGRIQFLNDMETPFSGVQAVLTSRHTPGHMSYRISSNGKVCCYRRCRRC